MQNLLNFIVLTSKLLLQKKSRVTFCEKASFLIKLQASGLIRNMYIYRAYSDDCFCSFKIHLIWAHLKFHYKLLFRSASATIPESKFSSSTFSSYPIPLWQCMMRKKTYMLFLVRQSFLPPLNYTNFFFTLTLFRMGGLCNFYKRRIWSPKLSDF